MSKKRSCGIHCSVTPSPRLNAFQVASVVSDIAHGAGVT
ncbi:hypothetical protein D3OALGA1CA_1167 [Olavius algarvensis associated proteobacterium Delta 3]|nr:hypothetical protein D3OALGA1CA_1167 [Olavius algarvensis associated proteobacterium Delta 3]CAB5164517.1 hypothetical protein D3OALGB2SA_5658 [Olavius algarvensis associated proteobacterium Delta 3]